MALRLARLPRKEVFPYVARSHSSARARRRHRRRATVEVQASPRVERLLFSVRARRRQRRRRRAAAALALLSLVAIALRIPGSDASLRLIQDLVEDRATAAGGPESSETTASMLRFRRSVFRSRPHPRPSPPDETSAEPATVPTSITGVVYAAATEFGLSGDYLLSVAACESGLDPGAYSAAGYHGLFQFDEQTWAAYGYGSIYDAIAQARTAARLLAAGQSSRWPNCS